MITTKNKKTPRLLTFLLIAALFAAQLVAPLTGALAAADPLDVIFAGPMIEVQDVTRTLVETPLASAGSNSAVKITVNTATPAQGKNFATFNWDDRGYDLFPGTDWQNTLVTFKVWNPNAQNLTFLLFALNGWTAGDYVEMTTAYAGRVTVEKSDGPGGAGWQTVTFDFSDYLNASGDNMDYVYLRVYYPGDATGVYFFVDDFAVSQKP